MINGAAVTFGFLTAFMLWNFSNFMHQYNAEIFPTRVRTTAAGFVYSISRVSTTILVLFIVFFIGARNAPGIFAFVWRISRVNLLWKTCRYTRQKSCVPV